MGSILLPFVITYHTKKGVFTILKGNQFQVTYQY